MNKHRRKKDYHHQVMRSRAGNAPKKKLHAQSTISAGARVVPRPNFYSPVLMESLAVLLAAKDRKKVS